MVEIFRVPHREVKVRVKLVGGQELTGIMYVPTIGISGGPGRLLDRLNDESDTFVPLTVGERTHLLQRAQILLVRVEDDEEDRIEAAIEEQESLYSLEVRVRLQLTSGEKIAGALGYLRPMGQERLLDYLNSERRFIALHVDRLIYLNKSQIVSALEMNDQSRY